MESKTGHEKGTHSLPDSFTTASCWMRTQARWLFQEFLKVFETIHWNLLWSLWFIHRPLVLQLTSGWPVLCWNSICCHFQIKPAAVKDAARTGGHSAASVASCPEAQRHEWMQRFSPPLAKQTLYLGYLLCEWTQNRFAAQQKPPVKIGWLLTTLLGRLKHSS